MIAIFILSQFMLWHDMFLGMFVHSVVANPNKIANRQNPPEIRVIAFRFRELYTLYKSFDVA